jgi:RNA polymerase III subunit RPC82 helix-turn-helix domain
MSGSSQHSKLCSILLKEAYGANAEKVAMCLFCMGNLTFPQIVAHCRLRPSKVRLSFHHDLFHLFTIQCTQVQSVLRGLINYRLVEFDLPEDAKTGNKSTVPIYNLRKEHVLFLHRYIR